MAYELESALDDVSWRILGELQVNARLSFSELGRRVGLTPPAVAERVRRLEEAGIITGYRVELNYEKIGRPILAMIRMTATEVKCRQLAEITRGIPEVLECHRVTGTDTYFLKIAVGSVHHLEALLDRLTQYGETKTSIVLSTPVSHRVIQPADPEQTMPAGPMAEHRAS